MYFQSYYGSFCRRFWRILHFAVIMNPFQTSFLAQKSYTLCSFIEMTECLQNCMFYRTIISNNASIVKWKLDEKIIKIRRLFCPWLTLRKRHILRLCHLVIPLLTKTSIYLCNLILIRLYIYGLLKNLLYSPNIWCLRHVQKVIGVL